MLQKLRDFQDLGHEVVVIIGDFTGMIGDPSGRSETRKPLTWDEIRANAETYRTQLGKVLEMKRTRIEFNSAWLRALTMEDVLRLTAHVTVAQMLQREDFAARYESGRPISLHELLYPVAQAYDSVALRADVELGGTDQTFNLLVGRDLQRAFGQEPQIALTVPLLEGLDGVQKMSKSLGNYVGINEKPDGIYGKLMSVPDSIMWRYFELLTRAPHSEMSALKNGHPMDAKKRLAFIIVEKYSGTNAAREAQRKFERVVQRREIPEILEEVSLSRAQEGAIVSGAGRASRLLWAVLRDAGLAVSGSEARRLIEQGAVEVDHERVSDTGAELACGRAYVIRVGKRRFKRVVME